MVGKAAPTANGPVQPRSAEQSRPVSTPDRTIFMIGNAHIDPVWLWTWPEGYQEARATFWSAIQRMDEYPDFVFTCDQVVLLSWVEESDPELFRRISERVAEGRWVNVGGWWVEPDCNLPMGESFARQGLYGQRFLMSRFGRPATVGMNVDPFGHNVMLPQILRGQGMDSYVFLRPGPHESDFADTLFWWQSPDGSRVLAYRIPHEYTSSGGSVDGQTDKSIGAIGSPLTELMVFYGVGNHGGGPTRANIESIHTYDRMGSFGRLQMASPRTYVDRILDRGPDYLDRLPVRTDDLQHHAPGCYSANSGIKAWQRRAQYALLSAERWAAVVAVRDGIGYPRDDLERAWKQVLFNQFHDILPGSAVESSYQDARDQLGEATAIAKRITTRAQNVIARQVNVPFEDGSQPVLVFNPHPWPVSATVEIQYGAQRRSPHVVDSDGRPVLFQNTQPTATTGNRSALAFRAELGGLGYRLYRLRPGPVPVDRPETPIDRLTVTEHLLENDLVRIDLDPVTGWISGYLDKQTGVDVVRGTDSASHTQICADPTDTWGHRVASYAWPGAAMRLSRIVVRESGPLRARVRIERSWGASTLIEELILEHDSKAVSVDVLLDWREPAHLMKLRFPTALSEPQASYEVPYGWLRRPVDGAEEPGQSWVDLTGRIDGIPAGLTVVTTNKHGYDTLPGDHPSIGITAVRSPVYSWHDPRRLDPDGIYRYQDQGEQRFSYQLIPHGGDWQQADPIRRAAELGLPLQPMQESFHGGDLSPVGSFASDGTGPVMVTAIKGSEDISDDSGGCDLIIRAVEISGRPTVSRIDIPAIGRTIEEPFGAHQVRTFRVPRDPDRPAVAVDLVEWPLEDRPAGVPQDPTPS
jgi:alpha-mannosidase